MVTQKKTLGNEDFLKSLLTTGIPFEKVCASKFLGNEWTVAEQYPITYECESGGRHYSKESIGDILASYYYRKTEEIDLCIEAFVECKARKKGKKWIFFEKTPYRLIEKKGLVMIPHLLSKKTDKTGSKFSYHHMYVTMDLPTKERKNHVELEDLSFLIAVPQCNAGVEVFSRRNERRVAIHKALAQVSLATIARLKNSRVQSKETIFLPIIVTNAELYICRCDPTKDFEGNATLVPTDFLLYHYTLPSYLHTDLVSDEVKKMYLQDLWILILQVNKLSLFISTIRKYFDKVESNLM